MEFLKVAGKTIQRPWIEEEDLVDEVAAFRGDFEIETARVQWGDQSGVAGEGSVSVALVSDVDLSESRLAPLELSDVRFEEVNLANAVLTDVTARRVDFLRCQAIGLRVSFVQASDIYAEDCRFDYATFRIDQVKNAVVFRRCSFREAVLVGDLSNVVFDECEMSRVEFDATRAGGCDFTTSRLSDVSGLLTLRGARIEAVQAGSLGAQFAKEAGLTVAG
ncbi:pentapeptide repeat-containing protein [Lentzea sp.]|uniref:pentapeptide repeat-containing protein n=1 Tax=Lentzea sp. TaxID=56099 RepID=UPI002C21AFA8|nr:pentapeptide repeat-containing protein [Lentzea sp.]HUQ56002.1 pentapeptide repeat-containing protein [Lentzea sp.]